MTDNTVTVDKLRDASTNVLQFLYDNAVSGYYSQVRTLNLIVCGSRFVEMVPGTLKTEPIDFNANVSQVHSVPGSN